MNTKPSIFTKIINREIPATIRYEDDEFIAIDDIQPAAPVHILIIPKKPFVTLEDVPTDDERLHAGLLLTARKIVAKMQIADNYKLFMNVGSVVQAVPHIHLHLLGGWQSGDKAEMDETNRLVHQDTPKL